MKKSFPKVNILVVISVIFVIVILISVVISINIGRAYRKEISLAGDIPQPKNITSVETTKVKKITVKKPGNSQGCMEVTPDGAVLIYDVCGQELISGQRISENNYIWQLTRLASQAKKTSKPGNFTYEITVETEDGSVYTYYIDPADIEKDSTEQQIINLIDKIEDSIPTPAPTGIPAIITPSVTPIVYLSPTPTIMPGVTIDASPTPTAEVSQVNGFTCDFYQDSSGAKPYRVSNIVCSTEPEAAQ